MQLAICTLAINGLLQSYIRAPPPRMMGAAQQREEAERKERLQQLFGKDFKDDVAKELARVKGVRQPEAPEAPPDWMVDPREGPKLDASDLEFGAKRMTLWLEDGGVNMEKILLVQAGERRLAVVTSRDVAAGETLFEVPDSLLLSADAAFAHPDVGRALRDMAAKQRVTTAGFETFAIATVLAVERVRRAAVKGVLKRQDDGILGVATGGASSVLPKWEVKDRGSAISNNAFNPFIASLEWPEEDECLVDSNEKAEAVRQGSQLIAKLIEPTSRTAWMKATQRQGLAQATSDEDCECTAMQALVLTMSTQLDPPPPLGQPNGMLGWGGKAREGPALCPLANLVIPPADVTEEATKAGTLDGLYNAQLGRPTTGSVDSAIRCVAALPLPAGTVILSDVPGATPTPAMVEVAAAARSSAALPAPGDRVRVMQGELDGKFGVVITLRPADKKLIVRLDGAEKKLAVLPPRAVEVAAAEQIKFDGKRRNVM